VLVKVNAVALNPGDGKLIDREPNANGCVLGLDYAGVVEKVADGEATKRWNKGNRVAGPVHGSKCPNFGPLT
jgi:NADPH:quinone reductase-like Zn-dependent oxidoreductase